MSDFSVFDDKEVLVIFAYAPAGLGHLRVTDALYHGLPGENSPILVGAHDHTLNIVHRLFSVNPLFRIIFDLSQKKEFEWVTTPLFRWFYRTRTGEFNAKIRSLVKERMEVPKIIVFIATHFGLAHELAVIKKKLEQDIDAQIILAVCVTDDSPQKIWYVPGADLEFVPSQSTKTMLESFGKRKSPMPEFRVTPYPVSSKLCRILSPEHLASRARQLNPSTQAEIHISVPVSGAAVGLGYYEKVINQLAIPSKTCKFHIITKKAPYTKKFISTLHQHGNVVIHQAEHDREVVALYEDVYEKQVISLEITKPSEQAFKALISPEMIGGTILLFTNPVGRQEIDNLAFLRRHALIPDTVQQSLLERAFYENKSLDDEQYQNLKYAAQQWRGLRLPMQPAAAVQFVQWALRIHLLSHLNQRRVMATANPELGIHGVDLIWHELAQKVRKLQELLNLHEHKQDFGASAQKIPVAMQ